jgi:hypothetical protein
MSFRLFVYYCALCGGWAAYLGWLLGVWLAPGTNLELVHNVIVGMFLGLMIAVGLGLVDAAWVVSWTQVGQILLRMFVSFLIGGVGGMIGGMIAHFLYDSTQVAALAVVGWTIVGILCGISVGSFDFLSSFVRNKDRKGANAKLVKCLLGGTIGGAIGAGLFLVSRSALSHVFAGKSVNDLFSPTAVGFVALGACIGLLVGVAQVILKEAWVKVEAGFRSGREMILAKEKTSVGRAEGTDIALFGDNGVEKLHAHIVLVDGRYVLEDHATPGGTYINDQRVNGRTPLQSGDRIRMGKSVLRFYERRKR